MRPTLPVVLALALGLAPLAFLAPAAGCDGRRGLHRRRDPGALIVARPADVQLLDPLRVQDSESIEVGSLIFEGLVRWNPTANDVEASLARAWEQSADRTVWTFKLRRDVVFHDDTRLDAAAVAFSFDRLLVDRHPAYLQGEDADYWRTLMRDVTKVTALDAETVEIRVARPYAPLLANLARFPIVSPAAVQRWGDAFKEHPVGTGPFRFEQWQPGDTVVVQRFPRYWTRAPQLDRIVFRVVVDARQRLVDLESGSVDLATGILPDEQPFVELHPDLELHTRDGNDVSYLAFNLAKRPFAHRDVRRAAAHAVNKDPIVRLAFRGRAAPAAGPLSSRAWAHHPRITRYPFDPGRARELLDAVIADQVFDPAVTYTLYAPSTPRPYLPSPERVARYLQASLAQVGIHTELRLQPYPQHRASVEAGEHDLALFGWIGDTGDPDNFLYVLFHGDSANNIAFYRDAQVDRLLLEAQAMTDPAARAQLYAEVQERIAEDAPWVPIAHSEYVVAARKELHGVVLSPLGHPVYAQISRRGER